MAIMELFALKPAQKMSTGPALWSFFLQVTGLPKHLSEERSK